ncbi:ABC transporter permease/M1 family aminopeptidase [Sphingobacterium sp. 1.A.4]|uniref:ABC transporter permease/M1 family aminopeptidase n=1 Tax=Sphingobacterium sp. 1.A.4 TaxID=2044603 RepID=UPI000C0BCDCA|nr:M1 family aminopeptidase [Sphingobacterium sp. 1.A.4]
MFSTIFFFEIKRWLKQPVFYVYCAIYFGLALFTSLSNLGAFDGVTSTTTNPIYINAPLSIAAFFNSFATLIYFLLPTIVGASVARDYMYNVHTLLFSYPLNKPTYLSAKFLSSLVMVTIIALLCALGYYAAQFFPNINAQLLGPNNFRAYVEGFFATIFPNFLLFGSIIFALVTFTRSIYVGFIAVLILLLLQSLLDIYTRDVDNRYMVALLDPFGFEPIQYYTKYWSVNERNVNLLPIKGVLLYNRLIWMGVALIILTFVYKTFSFSQSAFTFKRAKEGIRTVKDNFGSIITINLPKVTYNHGFWDNLKLSWRISHIDYKFLIRNWTFYILMAFAFLFVLMALSISGQLYGTTTYPVTWQMLQTMSGMYQFFLLIMVMLFAGMLIQRSRQANMNLLLDATSVPNWVQLLSKALALYKMVLTVFTVSLLNGLIYQIYQGYYHFEIGHYLYEIYVLGSLSFIFLILFALFVHSFFKNYFIGFIICLFVIIGAPFLPQIGVEQRIFIFNADPGFDYSDMNGYGNLRPFLYYRLYWMLLGLVLFAITLIFWRRGIVSGIKEKFALAMNRFKPAIAIPMLISLVAFVGLGYAIYHHNNIAEPFLSSKDYELQRVDYEKKYKKYSLMAAPRLTGVFVEVDMDPKNRNLFINGRFTYQNKTDHAIDSIFLNYSEGDLLTDIRFKNNAQEVLNDSVLHVRLYKLAQPLMPGDSMEVVYQIKNKPHTFLDDRSEVIRNGTFFNNSIFPSLTYVHMAEVENNDVRAKYGLPPKDRMADPRDSSKLGNNYISQDADWINFEAILSTNTDQIAIAPGYLQKEWEKDGKRYFHYKMDAPILNFYAFISAKFNVKKEKYKGKDLEIYYHAFHDFNLDRMMASMKKSLDYYEANYSPYQFNQMRVIEFPKTVGTFAQAFANTVPFSEAIGFIAKIDESKEDAVDYPYSVTAHEFAHQWWAHQVIGAQVKGATMMSESLSEYSSLKVLEQTYGKGQMRRYLKDALDSYLQGRAAEHLGENPLMFNENQGYIHYNKGSVVMYAMSEYLGEKPFNNFLKEYLNRTAFQNPPYTTSLEFVGLLRQHTPDSLQYLIKDMFETITLYDNKVNDVTVKDLKNGKYELTMDFQVSKYRTDPKGKEVFEDVKGTMLKGKDGKEEIKSLPLQDYVEIAVYGDKKEGKASKKMEDNPIYSKKVKIDKINNKVKLILDQKPIEVGVDPNNILIDRNSSDNRMMVKN